MHAKLRAADYLIYTAAIAIIIISVVMRPPEGSSLEVQAGESTYSFSLDKDGIYSVEGVLGITEIEVRDGRARIISSPCPNKTCISGGFQKTLVCLPNKVIASVKAEEADESTF